MTDVLDHIALAVEDLDERIEFFTQYLGMTLRRRGTEMSTGNRIAMLGQPGGSFKIELIEDPTRRGLQHIARRVDDVQAVFDALVAGGLKPLRAPRHIAPARADSALLEDHSGLQVQIVRYDPDSPDL
jgi:catechol 2,3-dioxygenase-like lactoylglutathione lyase family enzyme